MLVRGMAASRAEGRVREGILRCGCALLTLAGDAVAAALSGPGWGSLV